MEVIKYIDLCFGIGGFRIGINNFSKTTKKYKFKCVYSADIKKDAILTYNINFKEDNKLINIYDLFISLLLHPIPAPPRLRRASKGEEEDKGIKTI